MNLPGPRSLHPVTRTSVLLVVASWLMYLSVLSPSLATWDGGGMLNMSVSLVKEHDVNVAPAYGQPGRGGKLYGMWYPLLSVVAVPFVAVGLEVARLTHLPEVYTVAVLAIFLSTIIAACSVAQRITWRGGRLAELSGDPLPLRHSLALERLRSSTRARFMRTHFLL